MYMYAPIYQGRAEETGQQSTGIRGLQLNLDAHEAHKNPTEQQQGPAELAASHAFVADHSSTAEPNLSGTHASTLTLARVPARTLQAARPKHKELHHDARRMADSVAAATPALDCSSNNSFYEPLVGLRLGALFGILAVSSIGVFLPLFTYTAKLNKAYFLVRAFAAGVVLVTGYVHVLGDAIPLLSDPCLGLSVTYPWALVFASFSSMLAFTLEWNLNQYFTAKLGTSEPNSGVISTSVELGLDPEEISEKQREKRRLEYTVISTTFEAGVIFHSIFIGITIGISSSADTVRSLMIALMFHQMCEGLALGVTFVKAEYSVLKYCLLGVLFLVITPLGIGIGMGVGTSYSAESKAALGFEGGFDSLSAGILIYNGLVDLIVPTFSREELPAQTWLQGLGFISMFVGGAIMSLIAKWA